MRYVLSACLVWTIACSSGGPGFGTDGGVTEGGVDTGSDAGSTPTLAEICAYLCPADCPAKPSTADCATGCAASSPLRPEFMRAIYACLKATPCETRANCRDQAAAATPVSPAAEATCSAMDDFATRCMRTPLGRDKCLLTWRIFTDAMLAAARACLAKPCDEVAACIDAL
jgi:hypothetical protein